MINENDLINPFERKDEVANVKIDQFLVNLQNEIQEASNEAQTAEQLARLKQVAERYNGSDALIDSRELVEIIKNQPEQLKIFTSFNGLDEIIGGFRPQQLIALGALSKSGKTQFCMELTSKQAEMNPTWFPFEEGAEELVRKFMERGEEPPKFYCPRSVHNKSLKFIELRILEAIAKYDSKIFYIDNLDWIQDAKGPDEERLIKETVQKIKDMARDWNITIVLIVHVKKLQDPTSAPHFNDIKGSSSIYQMADTTIMLWRETKKEDGELVVTSNVNVSVQLNRKTGKTGNVKFIFKDGHYSEYDWKRLDEEMEQAFNFNDKKLL
jgi:replicative DNA helicase